MKILQPKNWKKPSGFSNGIVSEGKHVAIAGQVGWNEEQKFVEKDLVGQTRQALQNIATILVEAGAKPENVVRLTWYIKDKGAYLKATKELGAAYRSIFGAHYPAMSLIVVADLLESEALVEIEASAVI